MSAYLPVAGVYQVPPKPHEWWRDTLPTVPDIPAWEESIALLERVDEGVSLAVLRGTPSQMLALPAPGTAVFGIQVWLAGKPTLAFERGAVCRPPPGSLVLFQQPDSLGSVVRLPAGAAMHLVDVRFSCAALARATTFALADALLALKDADFSVPERGGLLVSCAAGEGLLRLASALDAPPVAHPAAQRVWRRGQVHDLLARVIDVLASRQSHTAPADLSLGQRSGVGRALALLAQRYMEPWSAADLARAAGVSEKTLRRGIRLATGTTIHRHVQELRLQAGARQLANGVAVTQVALDVGYTSLSHFSKAFRARFGVVPRIWRYGNRVDSDRA